MTQEEYDDICSLFDTKNYYITNQYGDVTGYRTVTSKEILLKFQSAYKDKVQP